MDAYDLFGACASVRSFLDVAHELVHPPQPRPVLGGRRRRLRHPVHRARGGRAALAAPLLPLVTEEIYRGLTGERSVHLTDWPDAPPLPADARARGGHGPRPRRVLGGAVGAQARGPAGAAAAAPRSPSPLPTPTPWRRSPTSIADEVNVKAVELTTDVAAHAAPVLQVVPAVAGPRLGPDAQQVIRAVKAATGRQDGDVVDGRRRHAPADGEFALRLVPADEHAARRCRATTGVVVLDTDGHARARGRGPGPRPRAARAAGPARRRAARERPDRADVRAGPAWVNALRHRTATSSPARPWRRR